VIQGPSFTRVGALPPASPVVISVPHGGRDYPAVLRQALRVPLAAVLPLEDRYIDTVARAARTTETMIVQERARAWIDLNRSEDERDPRVDEGALPRPLLHQSAKLRSGLGLVPRRASGGGDLWGRRFADVDVTRRIAEDHRP
jgi:N-formylglutamate amidohydrolase